MLILDTLDNPFALIAKYETNYHKLFLKKFADYFQSMKCSNEEFKQRQEIGCIIGGYIDEITHKYNLQRSKEYKLRLDGIYPDSSFRHDLKWNNSNMGSLNGMIIREYEKINHLPILEIGELEAKFQKKEKKKIYEILNKPKLKKFTVANCIDLVIDRYERRI